jgi:hypothetical protein
MKGYCTDFRTFKNEDNNIIELWAGGIMVLVTFLHILDMVSH